MPLNFTRAQLAQNGLVATNTIEQICVDGEPIAEVEVEIGYNVDRDRFSALARVHHEGEEAAFDQPPRLVFEQAKLDELEHEMLLALVCAPIIVDGVEIFDTITEISYDPVAKVWKVHCEKRQPKVSTGT